jgi:hypothetical protein
MEASDANRLKDRRSHVLDCSGSMGSAGVRRVDPVAFLCQIENEDRFERADSKSVPLESVHHVSRIVVGKEFPLESGSQTTVVLDLSNDHRICVSLRQGREDDRVVRVVSRSQPRDRRQDFDSLLSTRKVTALVVEMGQDFCKVDHLEANVANTASASRESKAMRNAV